MIKIKTWTDGATGEFKIVFYQEEGSNRLLFNFYHGGVYTVSPGMSIPDDYVIKIPEHLAMQVLKSLADSLDMMDVKTDSDAKLAGTLEATRYHLEDLRTLCKLKK